MTQAILLGAGRGSRLDAERGNGPKWALEVEGQSLAQHLVNVLHAEDVTDVMLVRGALGGSVLSPSVAYADVIGSPNMLHTLHEVADFVHGDVIIGYCDLLIEPRVIRSLLDYEGGAGVVVDRRWDALFALRDDNPISIAETCRIQDGRLVEIGQPIPRGGWPEAQYVGLMRFDLSTFQRLMHLYDTLDEAHRGGPWRNAPSFPAAYFTDFLQEAIDQGISVDAICIDGGWLEFDTPRDLDLARRLSIHPDPDIFDLRSLPDRPSVLSSGGVAVRGDGAQSEVLMVGSGRSGEWRIPKGMLDSGEDVEAAARREVEEETGVPVRISGPATTAEWVYDYGGRSWRERCYFFRLEAQDHRPPRPDAEHAVAAWIPATTAPDEMLYDEERTALIQVISIL